MEQLYQVIMKPDGKYGVYPIDVDPAAVVYVKPDFSMKTQLTEGKFDSELSLNAEFSIIGINGQQIHVVGEHRHISEKLSSSKKRVLNG